VKGKLKKAARLLAPLVLLGVLGAALYRMRPAGATSTLPTAPVRKGEFQVIVRCRGELKARRSLQVSAPVNVPELRIVWLAPVGGMVKAGDPIVRFDPSSMQRELREKEASLKQAQATLDQTIAQARIGVEQDKLDLAAAQYQVERAKLEASKAEIVSKIKGEESRIDLGVADRKLSVQEAGVKLNEVSNEAKIASLTRARDKALEEVELARERLRKMEIVAPITGLVNLLRNYSQGWLNAGPFKVGDQAWPGAVIAEIPDLETLEMEGKIEEIDRGRLVAGQDVRVRIDSLPEVTFPGKLAVFSPMTEMGWEWPPTRTFRGFAKLDKSDPRLRPGMNGALDVVVSRIPNAIGIPSKALFNRQGTPIVYVASGGGFRPVAVKVLARNPDEIAVDGIPDGSRVALVEPEKEPES
jgi:multidrug efflux pump subunit AcrA (membrane-fusion protein)